MTFRFSNRKKKRRKINWKLYLWLFIILFLISGISSFLLFSPYLKTKNIRVEGVEKVSVEEVTRTCQDVLSGHNFRIISKNNIIFLNSQELRNKLLSEFPIIKKVEITRELPSALVVRVEERKGVMNYCQESKCWRIDENGVAFEQAIEIYGGSIITLKDNSNHEIKSGDQVLDPEFVKFLLVVHKSLVEMINLNLLYFQINAYPNIEVIAATSEGLRIIFDVTRNYQEQVDALKRVLEEKIKENRDKLEYVDLRVENRVYYKMKE